MVDVHVLPPEKIETVQEFAAALKNLAGRTTRALEERLLDLHGYDHRWVERGDPATHPAQSRSKSVIATWLNGTHQPNRDDLRLILRSRGDDPAGRPVDEGLLDRWEEASKRASRNAWLGPPGAIGPVSTITDEQALSRLGIARAIELPGVDRNTLPAHIKRDRDRDLAEQIDAAANAGGLIVLVGPSGAGKSHAALNAIRTLLAGAAGHGDWWLLPATGPAQIHALADHPVPSTILWLDELRNYLDPGMADLEQLHTDINTLLDHRHPVLIIGGLWHENYDLLTEPAPDTGPDPLQHSRALLSRARVITYAAEFSPIEFEEGQTIARTDPRINTVMSDAMGHVSSAIARAIILHKWLETMRTFDGELPPKNRHTTEPERKSKIHAPGLVKVIADANGATKRITLTQDLAGHQWIVNRWHGALTAHQSQSIGPAAYGYAVFMAALHCGRLGIFHIIPQHILVKVVPGYLTKKQTAKVDAETWIQQGLEYATKEYRGHQPLHLRASAPGVIEGYTITDQLRQAATSHIRETNVPQSTRDILNARVETLTRPGAIWIEDPNGKRQKLIFV